MTESAAGQRRPAPCFHSSRNGESNDVQHRTVSHRRRNVDDDVMVGASTRAARSRARRRLPLLAVARALASSVAARAAGSPNCTGICTGR